MIPVVHKSLQGGEHAQSATSLLIKSVLVDVSKTCGSIQKTNSIVADVKRVTDADRTSLWTLADSYSRIVLAEY